MQRPMSGNPRFQALVSITLAAAVMRLLPHPYNFTPIAGMALFGGAHFRDRRVAFAGLREDPDLTAQQAAS